MKICCVNHCLFLTWVFNCLSGSGWKCVYCNPPFLYPVPLFWSGWKPLFLWKCRLKHLMKNPMSKLLKNSLEANREENLSEPGMLFFTALIKQWRFFVKTSRHSLFIRALKKPNVRASGLAFEEISCHENCVEIWIVDPGSPLRSYFWSKSSLWTWKIPNCLGTKRWGTVENVGQNICVKYRFYLRVWIFKLRSDFSCLRTCCWAQN